jgi:hypothetical protein
VAGVLAFAATAGTGAAGQDKDSPIQLKLAAKKDHYVFDAGGSTPAEYRKQLEQIADAQKNKQGGTKPLPAPAVDLVLQITNASKEDQTIYAGGTVNVYTFELKGPGVITLNNTGPMPGVIIVPRPMTLKPGASFDVPVTKLMDGRRGMARLLYWTEPGEYTLSVTYQLTDGKGQPTQLLKSAPVNITIEAPK